MEKCSVAIPMMKRSESRTSTSVSELVLVLITGGHETKVREYAVLAASDDRRTTIWVLGICGCETATVT